MSKFQINISGANAQIGLAIYAEGDVTASMNGSKLSHTTASIEDQLLNSLKDSVAPNPGAAAEVEAHIKDLAAEVQKTPEDTDRVGTIVDLLKKNYAWAVPAISEVIRQVAPTFHALFST